MKVFIFVPKKTLNYILILMASMQKVVTTAEDSYNKNNIGYFPHFKTVQCSNILLTIEVDQPVGMPSTTP